MELSKSSKLYRPLSKHEFILLLRDWNQMASGGLFVRGPTMADAIEAHLTDDQRYIGFFEEDVVKAVGLLHYLSLTDDCSPFIIIPFSHLPCMSVLSVEFDDKLPTLKKVFEAWVRDLRAEDPVRFNVIATMVSEGDRRMSLFCRYLGFKPMVEVNYQKLKKHFKEADGEAIRLFVYGETPYGTCTFT